jgi:3-hydroxybutyryl-CoA dehydratase
MFNKGDKFRQSYEVNPVIYQGFIDLFGDRNALHIDENYARDKGFKSKVIHGNILNGFISHFVGECLPIKNVIIYSQKISYFKPVYLYDILGLNVEVIDYHESVRTAELLFYFANPEEIKVAKGKILIGLL